MQKRLNRALFYRKHPYEHRVTALHHNGGVVGVVVGGGGVVIGAVVIGAGVVAGAIGVQDVVVESSVKLNVCPPDIKVPTAVAGLTEKSAVALKVISLLLALNIDPEALPIRIIAGPVVS